jgi:hypothetical protein
MMAVRSRLHRPKPLPKLRPLPLRTAVASAAAVAAVVVVALLAWGVFQAALVWLTLD